MNKIALGLTAAIAALMTAGPAEASWLRADTDNFIIYSESNSDSLRRFAENLQRYDATLRLRLRVPGGKEPNRLTVYLMPRAEDVGRLASGKDGSWIVGFYSPSIDGSFAVSNREVMEYYGASQSQQTLFHEYAHHFMIRYFGAAFPAWFVEGFAEYYSTTEFTAKGQYRIGMPAHARADSLLNMAPIAAEKLLSQQPSEMRNSGQTDVYYGRAWALTHMLYFEPSRTGQLSAYLDAINSGEDPKKAASGSFGDLAALDRDLNRYVRKPLPQRTSADPVPLPGTITITALADAEDALITWRIERRSIRTEKRRVEVRDEIRKLSRTYPGDAGVWFELARSEWDFGDKRDAAAARSAVEKAITLNPSHVRANVLLSQMMMADLEKKADATVADWNAARKPVALANRTDPDDPLPLYIYYSSFLAQGITPPPIAVDGLARAFALAPESPAARIRYAFALASRGEIGRALQLARVIAFNPHDDGQGEKLLEQIEAMRDGTGTAPLDDDGAGADEG